MKERTKELPYVRMPAVTAKLRKICLVLPEASPERFFAPPYLGHKGWVGMVLDRKPDWAEAAAQIRRSYSLIAPRRLAALA